jgi:NADH-quinone oxidoreductase subunit N
MACLVAFDKYRHNSAEAGAKFILTATFSSGVMIYGISLLYAACGTFQSACSTKLALAICTVGIVAFGICSYVFDWISVAANA